MPGFIPDTSKLLSEFAALMPQPASAAPPPVAASGAVGNIMSRAPN